MHIIPFSNFGVMRLALLAAAVVFILMAPDESVRAVTAWPLIVPTLLLPACAPLILMLVFLDLMMVKIMSASAEQPAEKKRLHTIMWVNFVVAIVFIIAWLPFFLSIGSAS